MLAAINGRDFQDRKDIRKSRSFAYEIYDKPQMKPLPGGSFKACDYKDFFHVPDNYHLERDGHYYSVSYTMHGKPAMLKATMTEIRICDENSRLLCKHQRAYKAFSRYITDDIRNIFTIKNSMPTMALITRGGHPPEPMSILIDRILRSVKH